MATTRKSGSVLDKQPQRHEFPCRKSVHGQHQQRLKVGKDTLALALGLGLKMGSWTMLVGNGGAQNGPSLGSSQTEEAPSPSAKQFGHLATAEGLVRSCLKVRPPAAG